MCYTLWNGFSQRFTTQNALLWIASIATKRWNIAVGIRNTRSGFSFSFHLCKINHLDFIFTRIVHFINTILPPELPLILMPTRQTIGKSGRVDSVQPFCVFCKTGTKTIGALFTIRILYIIIEVYSAVAKPMRLLPMSYTLQYFWINTSPRYHEGPKPPP